VFAYSDPTGTNFLDQQGALTPYRSIIHAFYREFARLPGSAFTLLEAFSGLASAFAMVTWIAFPKTATATFQQIDTDRFHFQDEYVEWRVERVGNKVSRVTFTTEFPEYYEALAQTGLQSLIDGIKQVIPGATPTVAELFGPGFDPGAASEEARAAQFRAHLTRNPWNNGEKGILCLTQQFNTMGALFNLVGQCGVVKDGIPSNAVCANVSGACGPERNSDPFICTAVQDQARAANGLSLQDPVGVKVVQLQGIWKIGGQQADINDSTKNRGVWSISRNGRRAVLDLGQGVTIGDDEITTGAQIATKLQVGASLIGAPDAQLPPWARLGQESSRVIG